MDLNFIVFPAPKCSYSEDIINGQLIFIPKYEDKENILQRGLSQNNPSTSSDSQSPEKEQEFSATRNKNFGSHTKPINYKKKLSKQANYYSNNQSFNFEDAFYNEESSHRIFYSTSSQRQSKYNSNQATNTNLENYPQNLAQAQSNNILIQKVDNVKKDKDYIQIMQKTAVLANEKKNTQIYEDSNKSCHELNSCDLELKEEDDEDFMQKDCNEFDEMYSNIQCNIKPDSITQYSFSKNQQQQNLQMNEKQIDSGSSKNSILQQKNDANNQCHPKQNQNQNFKKAQTMFSKTTCNSPTTNSQKQQTCKYLPCLYLNSGNHSPNYLLYFHGNGEDINLSYDLLSHMKNNLEINVIAMEYPGYGIYEEYDTSADKSELILKDAEYLYDYLTNVLHIDEKKIIVFGRSIGSGPATHVAAHRNPGALVLMSAFTSLRQVASDLVGKFLSLALKDRFNNLENIKNVTCPTFLVHGLIDKLISYNHSLNLFQNCGGICQISIPKEMTHVEFDFYEDFSKPLIEFLLKNKFNLFNYSPRYNFSIPRFLFTNPKSQNKIIDHQNDPQSSRSLNQFEPQKIYSQKLRSSFQ
ncbi:alpha/beta superfamily hydrolase (macronuclear) [Tetrahymena thermophila SB210]|uniref:Alpha/beta superfamily hydrolase n=1 Tax=Tetrahymena thermophila (strain SB210) TaxID=312017 RepID=I7LV99_TETTS|nr:alpha/beta superfamily hydrolase [Tetrahymena thermophila SB210]EAR97519.2 alpha/beta superfamily hydrolase [Tetrahymena thermophila SB210]|eukprot:XP_001017764.2 alpha/beta superfamily hydrolase [Tetrahymena thermophila SB210]